MKIKEFIEKLKVDKVPADTKPLTLSEGYRAYWEMKKSMWKNTVFTPLNDKQHEEICKD